eukprot:SAG25_NODE_44_length_19254_cov_246.998121_10_plen_70_part_00
MSARSAHSPVHFLWLSTAVWRGVKRDAEDMEERFVEVATLVRPHPHTCSTSMTSAARRQPWLRMKWRES